MSDAMWCLVLGVLACVGLHFSPRDSVRELVCAALCLAAVIAVPITALFG